MKTTDSYVKESQYPILQPPEITGPHGSPYSHLHFSD